MSNPKKIKKVKKLSKKDEWFNSLSKAEKRVAIAKDVIHQIKIKKYVPEAGGYVDIELDSAIDPLDEYETYTKDLKSNWNKIGSCTVCGLGACLVSTTRFMNKLTIKEADDLSFGSKAHHMLKKVFSKIQLVLIEAAFEESFMGLSKSDMYHNNDYPTNDYDLIHRAENFRVNNNIKDDDDNNDDGGDSKTLIAIMTNIVKNHGEFKP